jgi:mannose-6-phosphate isomerase-like protein (cupin superfamily)
MPACDFQSTYLRLRPDASIEKLPVEGFWPRLMAGELGNFHNEYLVTTADYSADWPSWEIHPNGDEIVCLLSGAVSMTLEAADGSHSQIELTRSGSFAFIPRATWHTAKVARQSRMLFITAGEGTQTRPA